MTIAFNFGGVSDVGAVRSRNEDSAYCSTQMLAVADGVAGGPAGDLASALTIDALRTVDSTSNREPDDPRALLLSQVEAAVRRIADACEQDPELLGMATTLTAVLIGRSGEGFGKLGCEVGLVHAGDSRLYLLHAGQLHLMTRDHSLPQLLLEEGHISYAEAQQHPRRSTIVRSICAEPGVRADAVLLGVAEGHRLLLCSDGLSDYASHDRMQAIVAVGTPQSAADTLLEEALASGSRDNITVVVADVVNGDLPGLAPALLGAVDGREGLDASGQKAGGLVHSRT